MSVSLFAPLLSPEELEIKKLSQESERNGLTSLDSLQRNRLHQAVLDGNYYRVKILVMHFGMVLEAMDLAGFTPLALAVQAGQLDIATFLLEQGAQVNHHVAGFTEIQFQYEEQVSQRNLTALHLAAANGDVAMLRLLIEQGARADHVTADGMSALHWLILASEDKQNADYIASFIYLLNTGHFNLNEQVGANKETALHLAIRCELFSYAHKLLQGGADPRIENRYGFSAIDLLSTSTYHASLWQDEQSAALTRLVQKCQIQAAQLDAKEETSSLSR